MNTLKALHKQKLTEAYIYEMANGRQDIIEAVQEISAVLNEYNEAVAEYEDGFLLEQADVQKLNSGQIRKLFRAAVEISQGKEPKPGLLTKIGAKAKAGKELAAKMHAAIVKAAKKLQDTEPVQGFDMKVADILGNWKEKLGADHAAVKTAQKLGEYGKEHPIKTAFIIAALTAMSGALGTPAFGAAVGIGLRSAMGLAKGERASTQLGKAAAFGAVGALAGNIADFLADGGQAAADAGLNTPEKVLDYVNNLAKEQGLPQSKGLMNFDEVLGKLNDMAEDNPDLKARLEANGLVPTDAAEAQAGELKPPPGTDEEAARAARRAAREVAREWKSQVYDDIRQLSKGDFTDNKLFQAIKSDFEKGHFWPTDIFEPHTIEKYIEKVYGEYPEALQGSISEMKFREHATLYIRKAMAQALGEMGEEGGKTSMGTAGRVGKDEIFKVFGVDPDKFEFSAKGAHETLYGPGSFDSGKEVDLSGVVSKEPEKVMPAGGEEASSRTVQAPKQDWNWPPKTADMIDPEQKKYLASLSPEERDEVLQDLPPDEKKELLKRIEADDVGAEEPSSPVAELKSDFLEGDFKTSKVADMMREKLEQGRPPSEVAQQIYKYAEKSYMEDFKGSATSRRRVRGIIWEFAKDKARELLGDTRGFTQEQYAEKLSEILGQEVSSDPEDIKSKWMNHMKSKYGETWKPESSDDDYDI